MSTTQLGNAKKIIDDNYEENPNSFLYDFCRNSFFCKEKFEEYLDAIGYLIAINYQRYKFDRVKLVQINDIQAQILIYLGYHKDPSDVIFIENLPEYINEGIITPLRERTNSYNSGFFNRDVFDYIIKNKHK